MGRKNKVLCMGAAGVDVSIVGIPPGGFVPGGPDSQVVSDIKLLAGGNALNQTITMQGLGLHPILHTAIGDDFLRQVVRDSLDFYGIEQRFVVKPGYHTATTVPMVDLQGMRNFYYSPGCMSSLQLSDFDLGLVDEVSLLSIAGLLLNPTLDRHVFPVFFRRACERGIPTVADCNPDIFSCGPEALFALLPLLDYFLPSYTEAQFLTQQNEPKIMAAQLKQLGARNVIIKLGEEGCYLSCHDFTGMVPALRVERIVDTTGAGDAFVASFIYGLLQGWPLLRVAQTATAVAAFCIQFIGANTHMRAQALLQQFLAQQDINLVA